MKLDNLAIGKSAVIVSVGGTGALRQHFLDMGLIQGVEVTMVKYAPMGDPIEIKIHDFELTLRKEDAQKIEVKEITKKEELKNENIIFHSVFSFVSCQNTTIKTIQGMVNQVTIKSIITKSIMKVIYLLLP